MKRKPECPRSIEIYRESAKELPECVRNDPGFGVGVAKSGNVFADLIYAMLNYLDAIDGQGGEENEGDSLAVRKWLTKWCNPSTYRRWVFDHHTSKWTGKDCPW